MAALLGATLTALAYWPGFMTWDAIRQYGQAVNGDFDDWHPPAMEWLWRQLIAIHAGPAPMLVVQLALEWGGLAALAMWAIRRAAANPPPPGGGGAAGDGGGGLPALVDRLPSPPARCARYLPLAGEDYGAARRGRRGLAAAIVACGFMPLALALTGEVLKDCLMAGALLAAAGALAWNEERGRIGRVALPTLGIALLVFAATLRFNAFLATAPLFVALLPDRWRSGRWRLAGASLIAVAVSLAAVPVANRLLDAKPSGVGLSLAIFDLGGMAHFSGANTFPPIQDFDDSDDPAGIVSACYDPSKWDRYAWWGANPCDIGFDNVQEAFEARHISPYRWWFGQVMAHPVAYAEHRLAHFTIATRLFSRDPTERAVQIDPPPNDWHYGITPSPLLRALDATAVWTAATPLGWPAAWLALAIGVLVVASALPSHRLILPLALSATLYGLGYAVVGVASEFRYHLWTMLAAAIAAAIAGSDLVGGAPVSRGRLALATAPLAIVLLLGIGWRLTSPA